LSSQNHSSLLFCPRLQSAHLISLPIKLWFLLEFPTISNNQI